MFEYSYGYVLNNWRLREDSNPNSVEYVNEELYPVESDVLKNITSIRMFFNNLDEHNFQQIHTAIIARTHKMTKAFGVI